jgi:plastocyanin
MNPRTFFVVGVMLLLPIEIFGQEMIDRSKHSGHQMAVDPAGVVMNQNHDELPRDCSEISRDYEFTIHAGHKYAADFPGMIFGMSQYEVRVQPCSRITISFVNEDSVRHQWMVHGLPKYLYPAGMFHIEATGGYSKTGTFIVPGDDRSYLVHCDMAQHMEKGMRGQLVVGKGSGDLWGVPGVSDDFHRFNYLPGYASLLGLVVLVIAFVATLWLAKKQ